MMMMMMKTMMFCRGYVDEETVNGDVCMPNNGPGSVASRNPSQGPAAQQANFPTSQAQVANFTLSLSLSLSLCLNGHFFR